jgi:Ca-activated chloride channel homolog
VNPPPSRAHRRHRTAFLILSFLTLSLPLVAPSEATNATQQKPASNARAISPADSATVKLTVTVLGERGGFIAGLTRDSFVVSEGKSQREISYFNGDALPASVGILIDVSRSMETRAIEAARSVALRFVEGSHAENEYFIDEFNSSARELTDWTRDREKIVAALNNVAATDGAGKKPRPKGLTALYDTAFAALEKVSQGTNPKRVLLIINDAGADTTSKHGFSELRSKIRASDALIYGVAIRERVEDFPDIVGQTVFDELCTLSGGRAYFPHIGKELDEVVQRLTAELQHQYVIGFTPANATQGGKWNKVKIKMSPANEQFKKLTVRSREGYFSPPASP